MSFKIKLIAALAVAGMAWMAPVAEAADIDVNFTGDVTADDGDCSLREAVQAAGTNTASGSLAGECVAGQVALDRILLDAGATYLLQVVGAGEQGNASGDLDLSGIGPVAIQGAGNPASTIDANDLDRALDLLDPDSAASIDGVRIRNGTAPNGEQGGGIRINPNAVLTLTDSTVTENLAGGAAGNAAAGGIDAQGTLTMTSSVVSDNDVVSTNSVVHGGGIEVGSAVVATITDSVIAGNGVTTNTLGTINGGGINNSNGLVTVRGSLISGNTLSNPGSPSNQVGGGVNAGLSATSDFALVNSTISGNTLDGGGSGAGLHSPAATPAEVIHSTIAANSGGVSSVGDAIGTRLAGTDVTVRGSVLSGPDAAEVCAADFGATGPTSANHNVALGTSCGFTMSNDAQVVPGLGPLAANGGKSVGAPGFQRTIETHAVQIDSPAVDRVSLAACTDEAAEALTGDARDFPRPFAAGCDSGAYEQWRCEDALASSRSLLGTEAANTLTGTSAADVLIGLGGNDSLNGGGGNDRVCGGAGTDTASFASGGAVRVDLRTGTTLGQGSDLLDGIENVTGSPGKDTLTGDGLANLLLGAGGADIFFGLGGNDTARGGAGNDTARGGAGADLLLGEGGRDRLFGQAGRDLLTGGKGRSDFCHGGGGKDRRKAKGCERKRRIP